MPKKIKKAGFINFEMNSDIVLAKNDIGKDEMNLVMNYTYKTNGINSKGLLYDYDYDIHNYRLKILKPAGCCVTLLMKCLIKI